MLFQCLVDVASTLKHARGGPTNHDMVLAHLGSVEHGIECRYLIHSDRGDIQDLCYLHRSNECYVGAARHPDADTMP